MEYKTSSFSSQYLAGYASYLSTFAISPPAGREDNKGYRLKNLNFVSKHISP